VVEEVKVMMALVNQVDLVVVAVVMEVMVGVQAILADIPHQKVILEDHLQTQEILGMLAAVVVQVAAPDLELLDQELHQHFLGRH